MKPEDKAVARQALEALEDFADVIKYDDEQDDIGRRACCDVLSYNQHSEDCKAYKSITALRQLLEQPAPVQELQRYSPDGEGGMEVDSLGAYVKLREKDGV